MKEEKDTTIDNPSEYKPIYKFPIAGVQHHRIKDVLSKLEEGQWLTLRTEPTNKFDPNAIRIEFKDTMLGYVPKMRSAEISAKLSVGKIVGCKLVYLNKLAKPWDMTMVEIMELS